MADQTMTLYKGDRQMDVDPSDYKARQEAFTAKGWVRNKPSAKTIQQPDKEQPFTKPGFMAGMGAGLNPFHSAPENMPVKGTMGGVGNAAADMFNVREIANRGMTGDVSGAVGQGIGTGIGTFGPMAVKGIGKAIKAAKVGERAMNEVPMLAKAATRGAELAKQLKVSPDVARVVERYAMPLRNALDKKFDVIHKALNGKAIVLGQGAQDLIKEMSSSEVPAIKRLAEGLMDTTLKATKQVVEQTAKDEATRSVKAGAETVVDKTVNKIGKGHTLTETGMDVTKDAMSHGTASKETAKVTTKQSLPSPIKANLLYENAHELKKSIQGIISNAKDLNANHWVPQLTKLSEAVDHEVGALAKQHGMGDAWKGYKESYKQVMELTKAAAATAKTKTAVLRPTISALAGAFGGSEGAAGRIGAHLSQEIEAKISPIVEAQAKKLAKKLGVSLAEMEGKTGAMEKGGTAMKWAGRGGQYIPPLQRGIQTLLTERSPAAPK